MTKNGIQQPHERGEEVRALAIIDSLERWLGASPGRRVAFELSPAGWIATLHEPPAARTSGGSTLTDCLAQVATVASLEAAQVPR